MALNKNKDLKVFYSIRDVAQMFDLTESLLRYWEKEFPNIKPRKAGRGVRQYTKEDIEQIRIVYHLVKERGMTLDGARKYLSHNKKSDLNKKVEVIDMLTEVRNELQGISKELNSLV